MENKALSLEEEHKSITVDELMLGDWINTPKGCMKVRAINQDGTVLCGLSKSPKEWVEFTEYEIRPTYLYWDILMENGFIDRHTLLSSCEFKDHDNKMTVSLEEYPDPEFREDLPFICTIFVGKEPTKQHIIRLGGIKYVHELQHILRLAGVTIHRPIQQDHASLQERPDTL